MRELPFDYWKFKQLTVVQGVCYREGEPPLNVYGESYALNSTEAWHNVVRERAGFIAPLGQIGVSYSIHPVDFQKAAQTYAWRTVQAVLVMPDSSRVLLSQSVYSHCRQHAIERAITCFEFTHADLLSRFGMNNFVYTDPEHYVLCWTKEQLNG